MKLFNQISFSGSIFKLNWSIIQEQTQGYQSPSGKGTLKNFYWGADSYKEGKALSAYLWLEL